MYTLDHVSLTLMHVCTSRQYTIHKEWHMCIYTTYNIRMYDTHWIMSLSHWYIYLRMYIRRCTYIQVDSIHKEWHTCHCIHTYIRMYVCVQYRIAIYIPLLAKWLDRDIIQLCIYHSQILSQPLL